MDDKNSKRVIADKLQEHIASVYKMYEPLWGARADVLKVLVSVSSASIVLSVTFSSSLLSLKAGLFWRYLVVLSFAMFAFSLMSALAALWIGVRLHGMQSNMFEKRRVIQKAVEKVDPSAKDPTEPFADILEGLNRPIEKKEKWAWRLSSLSFVCFGQAVILLTIIGVRQLLP